MWSDILMLLTGALLAASFYLLLHPPKRRRVALVRILKNGLDEETAFLIRDTADLHLSDYRSYQLICSQLPAPKPKRCLVVDLFSALNSSNEPAIQSILSELSAPKS